MIVGPIQRSFNHLDFNPFKTLYISFVRPHLEYASPIWSPYVKKHVNLIGKVQKRATKRVEGFKNLPYAERLRRLQLPTLTYRRLKADMVKIFKNIHVYDKDTIPISFQLKSSKYALSPLPSISTKEPFVEANFACEFVIL